MLLLTKPTGLKRPCEVCLHRADVYAVSRTININLTKVQEFLMRMISTSRFVLWFSTLCLYLGIWSEAGGLARLVQRGPYLLCFGFAAAPTGCPEEHLATVTCPVQAHVYREDTLKETGTRTQMSLPGPSMGRGPLSALTRFRLLLSGFGCVSLLPEVWYTPRLVTAAGLAPYGS